MIIRAWNIRTLNSPLKQKEGKLLINKYKLVILGLIKTKVKKDNTNRVVRIFMVIGELLIMMVTLIEGEYECVGKIILFK